MDIEPKSKANQFTRRIGRNEQENGGPTATGIQAGRYRLTRLMGRCLSVPLTGRYIQSLFLQTRGGRERREGGHDYDRLGRQHKPASRRRGRRLRSGTVVHIRAAFEGLLRRVHLSEHPHRPRHPGSRHPLLLEKKTVYPPSGLLAGRLGRTVRPCGV